MISKESWYRELFSGVEKDFADSGSEEERAAIEDIRWETHRMIQDPAVLRLVNLSQDTALKIVRSAPGYYVAKLLINLLKATPSLRKYTSWSVDQLRDMAETMRKNTETMRKNISRTAPEKRADAVSYSWEQLYEDPELLRDLVDIHKEDFERYRQNLRTLINIVESAFPEKEEEMESLYREATGNWMEWAEALDDFSMTGRGQGKIHELEKHLWNLRKIVWRLYQKASEILGDIPDDL